MGRKYTSDGSQGCHFVGKGAERVLIPGCWGSLHQDDLSHCTCHDTDDDPPTHYELQRMCTKAMDDIAKQCADIQKRLDLLGTLLNKIKVDKDGWPAHAAKE